MHQIDTSSALPALPEIKPAGTPGYFSKGDKDTNTLPTRLDKDWMNAAMMETVNVIEAAGITLDKSDRSQLYKAIYKLIYGTLPSGGGSTIDNPLTAGQDIGGVLNNAGPNITISASTNIDDEYGQILFWGHSVRFIGTLILNEGAHITSFSDDEVFTTGSNSMIGTQRATKQFLDDIDPAEIGRWNTTTIYGFSTDSISLGTTRYVGRGKALTSISGDEYYQFNMPPIKDADSHKIKNLYVDWLGPVKATFTLMINGVANTNLVISPNNETGPMSVLLDNDEFPVGDFDSISLKVVVDGASDNPVGGLNWSVLLEV